MKLWAMGIAKRSWKPKAIVALARKIAIAMHAMWISGKDFEFGLVEHAASVNG